MLARPPHVQLGLHTRNQLLFALLTFRCNESELCFAASFVQFFTYFPSTFHSWLFHFFSPRRFNNFDPSGKVASSLCEHQKRKMVYKPGGNVGSWGVTGDTLP